jgi:hypothetical protein
MSLIRTNQLVCPGCGAAIEFPVAFSVNADRRRDEILDGTFQTEECPGCGKSMRLAPEMTYLDVGRGQWILVRPAGNLREWAAFEDAARKLFADSYGPQAARAAQELGSRLSVRVVFGWPALREKLVCREHDLDDVELELLKLAILRSAGGPLDDKTELRLLQVAGDKLVLGWIDADTEVVAETLEVPAAAYREVAADARGWAEARKQIRSGPYADLDRMLVEPKS